jgi:hypothetical protein
MSQTPQTSDFQRNVRSITKLVVRATGVATLLRASYSTRS